MCVCVCVLTFKGGVNEFLPVGAEESVSIHQVQTAQQQVVRVDQIVTDHTEVSCSHTHTNRYLAEGQKSWHHLKRVAPVTFGVDKECPAELEHITDVTRQTSVGNTWEFSKTISQGGMKKS